MPAGITNAVRRGFVSAQIAVAWLPTPMAPTV